MLVVGSQALLSHGVKIGRKPSDVDVIGTESELWDLVARVELKHAPRVIKSGHKMALFLRDGRIVDCELAQESGIWLSENYGGLGYPRVMHEFGEAAHPDVVLALKLSHRYLKNSPHFRKTMDDILALRGLKFRVPPALGTWMKDRERETYDYKHPSLKRDKAKFFSGDGIDYVYEHDDIHEALATIPPHPYIDEGYPRPAYVQFQKDRDVDVSVSREKWDRCTSHVKLMSVLEESYVLALERSQIPCDFGIAPRTSFLIALEKVCTSITSGWWREYAWEHYYQVLGMYSDDYVERFQAALAAGKIRPYQGEKA